MRQTALIYLHVPVRLQLINCFKRRTSHELNFNTRFQLPSSLRAFDAVYQGNSKFARKTSKTQTALIGSIFSDERTRHFDALTQNLFFCAYSGLQNTLKIH